MERQFFRKLVKAAFIGLLLCGQGTFHQKVSAQEQKSTTISLAKAIENVEKKYGYHFVYEHGLLNGKSTTAAALNGKSAQEVLKNILYPNNLVFLYIDEKSYVIQKRSGESKKAELENPSKSANADHAKVNSSRPVGGIVTDNGGTPLSYVLVLNQTNNVGTQTSDNGKFFLAGMNDGDSIVFNIIGYKRKTLVLSKNINYLDVELSPLNGTLDNVNIVSNGLQTLPKERATGAITTLTSKDLEKIPTNNIIQRIEGLVPGLKVNILAGDRSFMYSNNQIAPNGGTRTIGINDYSATIRGTSTVSSASESFPLIVVDGAIADIDMSSLNPTDIESISFLKDAAAASIWGVRAANGVFVVTTKKGKASAPKVSASVNYMIANRPNLSYMKLMNSSQMLDYEKELVDRGLINQYNFSPINYYSTYYPQYGAKIAYDLKSGTITQAQYDQQVDSLSQIDNQGQIQQYLLQPASSQNYNVSFSGGTDKSSYFYSASYSKELPNFKRNIGQRLTFTMNNTWKLFNWATLSTSLKGAFMKYNTNGMSFAQLYKPGSTVLMPYQLFKDADGNNVHYNRVNPSYAAALQATSSKYLDWTYSYLDELNNNSSVQTDNNYTINVNLKMPIYKGLSGTVLYTNERKFSNSNLYYNPNTYYYRDFYNSTYNPTATGTQLFDITTGGGIYSPSNTQLNNYALRGQLAYDGNLGADHQLNIIAGSEIRQTETLFNSSTLYGYNPISGFSTSVNYASNAYLNAMGNLTSLGGTPVYQDIVRRYLSYFSNGAYTYKSKYTLSASVRYDDYNNFGLDKKYRATPLWSSGFKWDIYKERFMERVKWVDFLFLRTTFGVNGNISTTQYPFTNIAVSNDYTTNLPSASISALANPQLRWEKTYVTNIGLDFGLLHNLINGGVDIYTKRGRDLLYAFPINSAYAGTIGGNLLTTNAASMNGSGIDAHLQFNIMNKQDWSWATGVIFSYNTNKIVDNKFDTSTITPSYINYSPAYINNVKGYASDMIFAFKNAGLDANGNTLVYNSAGVKVPYSTSVAFKDLVAVGRRSAPYFGSWNTTLRYKYLSLYVLATYQFGGRFIRPVVSNYITSYYTLNYDDNGMIADRWKEAGDENKTNVPGLAGTATSIQYNLVRYQNSDINILSSDYIRLREVSLTYQIPSSLSSKKIIQNSTFSFAVRNLGLLWKANKYGYDPDFVATPGTSTGLPAARSYNFSLNLNF